MKVKVFTVTHPYDMEQSVNAWLGENPSIEVQHVRQSESMNKESWSMTLSVFYTGSERAKIGFETGSSEAQPREKHP